MSNALDRKKLLAQTMKELMKQYPLEKITVGQIAEECGINRQTFYYHFYDKYDLVNWIYVTETEDIISCKFDAEHWADGMIALCNYFAANKAFYINALGSSGQNSFREYLYKYIEQLFRNVIQEILNVKQVEKDLDDAESELIVSLLAHGFVGILIDSAKTGLQGNTEEIIMRLKSVADKVIRSEFLV